LHCLLCKLEAAIISLQNFLPNCLSSTKILEAARKFHVQIFFLKLFPKPKNSLQIFSFKESKKNQLKKKKTFACIF